MPRIEDYALLSDTHSAALVSNEGSIDWLCLPRFDSAACMAALLDPADGGHWWLGPADGRRLGSRAYRPDSLVLDTTYKTSTGVATVTDCLILEEHSDPLHPRRVFPTELLVRSVTCERGRVDMASTFVPRFDYGGSRPWMRTRGATVEAVAGPDALDLRADVPLDVHDASATARFSVEGDQRVSFVLSYHLSHVVVENPVGPAAVPHMIEATDRFWRDWIGRCVPAGARRELVTRSLLTLKGLTYSPTGGIVAAPTTSLPEQIGGVRNWDYRYCWLRDATYTLDTLLDYGFTAEAEEWRNWLLRAVAGDPEDLQIMYGVLGERRLIEYEVPWLSGYEGSAPVRVGNAAVEQFQLDVYGEVMDAFHSARRAGIATPDEAWSLERAIVEFVCERWREPDEGIWEVRSGREHFVHSKVMAWVALDRAIKAVRRFGEEGPVERWEHVRAEIRDEVLERGYDRELGHFVRAFGSQELDASLLMLPLVRFIDAGDPRMERTIEAIRSKLVVDGLVQRYDTAAAPDGLPPGEGAFLMCTLWLADCLLLLGRGDEAEELLDRVAGLANDVGLLAEQYDPRLKRLVGNFPQAFSHTALVTCASLVGLGMEGPAAIRGA